ncbi:GPI mannosyltransferase 2 [Syncephalastrum racemosum]|uniref:GPI mannosyltransferase 2 n=1 Tax=Syncephalastrum racemosum TaxID=13706 RepID=A0A1X2HC29_SYNRA|nr:GPI mannosyltransferase 2 [Syncephalastrum racemosum]
MLRRVYAFAATSRVLVISVGIASFLWTGTYDSSADLELGPPESWAQSCLNTFLRWDAIYFNHIANRGYIYEQQHAFFPLLPLCARVLANTVLAPLHSLIGTEYTTLLAGILITNVAFVLAAGALYQLTRAVFPQQPALATVAGYAFALSPPAMFMSSLYTESPFALLTFWGMLQYVRKRYLLAALLWGLASAMRSNAIIYAGFFVFDALVLPIVSRHWSVGKLLVNLITTLLYSLVTFSGFVGVQYYGYTQYCQGELVRPWCDQQPPLLYGYVQKVYWNNGLFAYYELKQIPNFLLAAPIIALSAGGIWLYASKDWTQFLTLGALTSPKTEPKDGLGAAIIAEYTSKTAAPFIYLWAFLLVYATTCMHVQVILRFFTSVPGLYWFTAVLWIRGYGEHATSHQRWTANAVLSYYVLYGLVGIVLFAAFLPPA